MFNFAVLIILTMLVTGLAVPWEALFAYDVIIISLTVLKTWKARHCGGYSPGYITLFDLILRDGVMYFT